MSWRGGYDFIRLRTALLEWRSERWQWRDSNRSKWWYGPISRAMETASSSALKSFSESILLTPAFKKCSVLPRHNYCPVQARPNCERRCSIRLSAVEGHQLGKCFQKTPRCLPSVAPGRLLMSFFWLCPNSGESHNTWWASLLKHQTNNIRILIHSYL